mgnify:FL=1
MNVPRHSGGCVISAVAAFVRVVCIESANGLHLLRASSIVKFTDALWPMYSCVNVKY